jgi:ribosomal protein S18 acetylase RimI-like enzyme
MVLVRLLDTSEVAVLERVAPDVFDDQVNPHYAQEFMQDPRHHLAVAVTPEGLVIGMASGVHYLHPDKAPTMFINEVGVSAAWEGQGIGRRLVAALLHRASVLGCADAWTATEPDNHGAQALYTRCGGVKDPSPFVMFTFPVAASAGSLNPLSADVVAAASNPASLTE